MAKAVALFSGGLDSSLAILSMLNQGISIKAIAFKTPFNTTIKEKILSDKGAFFIQEELGVEVNVCFIPDSFIDIVKNPKFGYGKNMNPCIDCRILMLREAKILMDKIGADFIITGEVLGQRPMSQRRDIFYLIDREAGLSGYVLRPLSAKLLDVTLPEKSGIVKRDMLFELSGRSRKSQIELAKKFGLKKYPAPAGGCLLTEPNYAKRLKDLLSHNPDLSHRDIEFLKIGRHFRFSPTCKIIVGRNKEENEIMELLSKESDCLIKVEGYGSPTTIILGEINDDVIQIASSLCARYSDAKNISVVQVRISYQGDLYKIMVSPSSNEILEDLRIDRLKTDNITKA